MDSFTMAQPPQSPGRLTTPLNPMAAPFHPAAPAAPAAPEFQPPRSIEDALVETGPIGESPFRQSETMRPTFPGIPALQPFRLEDLLPAPEPASQSWPEGLEARSRTARPQQAAVESSDENEPGFSSKPEDRKVEVNTTERRLGSGLSEIMQQDPLAESVASKSEETVASSENTGLLFPLNTRAQGLDDMLVQQALERSLTAKDLAQLLQGNIDSSAARHMSTESIITKSEDSDETVTPHSKQRSQQNTNSRSEVRRPPPGFASSSHQPPMSLYNPTSFFPPQHLPPWQPMLQQAILQQPMLQQPIPQQSMLQQPMQQPSMPQQSMLQQPMLQHQTPQRQMFTTPPAPTSTGGMLSGSHHTHRPSHGSPGMSNSPSRLPPRDRRVSGTQPRAPRTKRMDQGPLPSSADIYPDDASPPAAPLPRAGMLYENAYLGRELEQDQQEDALRVEDHAEWPTPAEVFKADRPAGSARMRQKAPTQPTPVRQAAPAQPAPTRQVAPTQLAPMRQAAPAHHAPMQLPMRQVVPTQPAPIRQAAPAHHAPMLQTAPAYHALMRQVAPTQPDLMRQAAPAYHALMRQVAPTQHAPMRQDALMQPAATRQDMPIRPGPETYALGGQEPISGEAPSSYNPSPARNPSPSISDLVNAGRTDELVCDRRSLTPGQKDGTRYGVMLNGIGMGHSWAPPAASESEPFRVRPRNHEGWGSWEWAIRTGWADE
ncbi:hypothetical protein BU26DRAFT_269796 [Trematosphaeria pertusa]|uniref:Uncharacterized protein n=1 Tax=Trematosphaeria pertusa TaxID=390896 RepID=A0A6A6IKQ0_9PLEO|nr:uncharacterized protein BU26DRAFT_269796 [Trematosphaeria pertusa]KAF2250767.1 hypothetical protein BU26DRAFT_269796 [Trematosphaeria pertusa]